MISLGRPISLYEGETARCAPAVEEETSCCASATARCAPAVKEETSFAYASPPLSGGEPQAKSLL